MIKNMGLKEMDRWIIGYLAICIRANVGLNSNRMAQAEKN